MRHLENLENIRLKRCLGTSSCCPLCFMHKGTFPSISGSFLEKNLCHVKSSTCAGHELDIRTFHYPIIINTIINSGIVYLPIPCSILKSGRHLPKKKPDSVAFLLNSGGLKARCDFASVWKQIEGRDR